MCIGRVKAQPERTFGAKMAGVASVCFSTASSIIEHARPARAGRLDTGVEDTVHDGAGLIHARTIAATLDNVGRNSRTSCWSSVIRFPLGHGRTGTVAPGRDPSSISVCFTPATQRLRVDAQPLTDPATTPPDVVAGSRRSTTAIGSPVPEAPGYFLGAASTFIVAWNERLHQTWYATSLHRVGSHGSRYRCVARRRRAS